MVLMILERVPASLRGELTRWMLEPKVGVFVGKLTAVVRELLWQKACRAMAGGAGILIYPSGSEQGFMMRFWGATSRSVVDCEGLTLVAVAEGL
jgi:CRISPR-associated protein Cas2